MNFALKNDLMKHIEANNPETNAETIPQLDGALAEVDDLPKFSQHQELQHIHSTNRNKQVK